MGKKQEIMALDKAYFLPVFNRLPLALDYGEGAYVYDTGGKKYLDFLAGIAVNSLGYGHPKLVAAISEQAGRLIHCSNLYYTEGQARLCAKLAALSKLSKVFIANSGAEANDGAIKLARKYGKSIAADKYEIITAARSFHGRTLATLTATGQPSYQQGFGPLLPGFTYVPFNDLQALKNAVSKKTCAVMLEPIQGEGGIQVPAQDYLAKVKEICEASSALLIFDEIQTGIGRTGKMFACEHYAVLPDIITLAKGLGGGVPIGSILVNEKVSAIIEAGDHGSTFGGNPLACAAANAVLAAIEQENLCNNAAVIGEYLHNRLTALQNEYPRLVTEVRGKGLIIGLELSRPGRDIVLSCLEYGAIINCTANNVLRFVPPLIVSNKHVDELIEILAKVLADYTD